MEALIVLCVVAVSQAQYSHVRYQPEKRDLQAATATDYYGANIAGFPHGVPADSYQVPAYTYLRPPEAARGPPDSALWEPQTFEKAAVTNGARDNAEENVDGDVTDDKGESNVGVETVEGAYYVLLPGSRLQRVQFRTEKDPQNMAYAARLQYRHVGRVPIFVYNARRNSAYVQSNKQ